jgi:hypothetical protein
VCPFLIVYTYLYVLSYPTLTRFIGKKCSCAHTNRITRQRILHMCVLKWLVSSYLIVLLYNKSLFFLLSALENAVLYVYFYKWTLHIHTGEDRLNADSFKSIRSIRIAATLYVFFSFLCIDINEEDQIATNKRKRFSRVSNR